MINEVLSKLINEEYPTETELREVWDEIFSGLADSVISSSFITAYSKKEYNEDDISNAILSARDAIKQVKTGINPDKLFENISLCDYKGYVDIPFAVDIICAANGLYTSKYSVQTPVKFTKNNSFETFSSLGCKIPYELDINFFEKNYFGYFYLNNDLPYYKYTLELSQKLPFFNILNYLNLMLNPTGAKNCMIGIQYKDETDLWAKICLKLNYSNSIIINGANKLPFAVLEGETYIAEAWKNKIFSYILTNDLVELETETLDELKVENKEHNLNIIEEVFSLKTKKAPFNTIILNSALALYISKITSSLIEGIELARATIDSKRAYEMFESIKDQFKQP